MITISSNLEDLNTALGTWELLIPFCNTQTLDLVETRLATADIYELTASALKAHEALLELQCVTGLTERKPGLPKAQDQVH